MKRIFATVLILMMVMTLSLTAFAEGTTETAEVYVTISDDNGKLVLAQEKITVSDTDSDGALTINDALYSAHEAKYEGGAAAGYAAIYGAYGLSLNKLWGVANGGSYGYYVNNASAWSLTDVVESGDYINAYAFTDLTAWSDTYSYFDVNTVTATQDDEVSLTLLAAGYDAYYNPVTLPVAGATITVNGTATEYKTDAEGKVTVKLTEAGTCVISAVSETQTLVPPVCVATVAEIETVDVYVTISDNNGALVMAQEPVTISDTDDDGAITINDALYAAHEAKYEGGAAAGYASSYGAYGLSLNKLWGVANGGSYGYYVNNVSAWSLTDVVNEGDYVNAFIYTDLTAWSDTYCYFDVNTVTTEAGKAVTVTLLAAGYDANYNPVNLPVAGATITVNGEETEVKTDVYGKATITINEAGTYIISAVSDTQALVPPVCKATVTATAEATTEVEATTVSVEETTTAAGVSSPETGDMTNVVFVTMLMIVSFAGIIVISVKGRKSYEK